MANRIAVPSMDFETRIGQSLIQNKYYANVHHFLSHSKNHNAEGLDFYYASKFAKQCIC